MSPLTIIAIAMLAPAATAGDDRLADDATITVSADESWEDEDRKKVSFRGNVEIHTPDWSLFAGEVIVIGSLDAVERVTAEGSPLRFRFTEGDDGEKRTANGAGRHLIYHEAERELELTGDAELQSGRRSMASEEIRYRLRDRMLLAGGPGGVHLRIEPAAPDEAD